MFEKEIILKEQLAHGASSSVARPENCRPTGSAVLQVKASHLVYISHPGAVDRVIETAARAVK